MKRLTRTQILKLHSLLVAETGKNKSQLSPSPTHSKLLFFKNVGIMLPISLIKGTA